jgi:hypothetical protein
MTADEFRDRAPVIARAIFIFFGALYLFLGFGLGGRGVVLIWLGLSLLLVGIAYATGSTRLIGKRSDGSFHLLARLVHVPFFAVSRVAWVVRQKRGEPPWNEVAPGIFVGRMPGLTDVPPGAPHLFDLTCELRAPFSLRVQRYHCLPTLDGTAPDPEKFRALVKVAASFTEPVFIFCAAGHGRSATLAAAVLVERGLAADVAAAEAMMKQKRPLIGLGSAQRLLVAQTTRRP